MRRRILLALTATAAVVAVGLPSAWFATRPHTDAGARQRYDAAAGGDVSEQPPTAARGSDGQGIAELGLPRITTRSARIEDHVRAQVGTPVRLTVGGVDIAAAVVPVGVEADGEMEVPADVATVGWYRHGPAPGAPGSAVVAGHVDARDQGRGAFFDLRRVEPGSEVVVTDDAGRERRFEVVARRQFAKSELPVEELFSTSGDPRLVLVTCGGSFDAGARSYSDNIVVYAVPRAGSVNGSGVDGASSPS